MNEIVAVTAIVAMVCIVAIVFGRGFTGRINDGGVSMEVNMQDQNQRKIERRRSIHRRRR